MPLTLRTTELQYKDSHNVYHGINAVAEKPTADVIADLNAAINNVADQINAQKTRADEIIEDAQTAVDNIDAQRGTMIAAIADAAGLGTDTTFTQQGMAADSKTVGDMRAAVLSGEASDGSYHLGLYLDSEGDLCQID